MGSAAMDGISCRGKASDAVGWDQLPGFSTRKHTRGSAAEERCVSVLSVQQEQPHDES